MIETEFQGDVAVLRMARGKGNALNLDLVQALLDSLDRVQRHSARSVVITGQKGIFGAGVDLSSLLEGGPDYTRRFLPLLIRSFERVATFPKPLVAAINGHAIAGGAIIAMACDWRIMARGPGRIGLTEIQVGVLFPAWALEIARFAAPTQHFSEIVCAGRTYLPEQALERGLVHELIEADQLLGRACDAAREFGRIDPSRFAANKMAVRRPLIETARRESALSDANVVQDWCSEETRRLIAAYFENHVKRRTE
jgi:enoyl-CoA hydratase